MQKKSFLLIVFLVLAVVAAAGAARFTSASDPFASPIDAPPTPSPMPPPSNWAQMAREYISKQYDVPLEYLLVINEHERHYPLSERVFQAFTILDTRPTTERLEYLLLIDKKTKGIEENMAAVQEAENAAQQAKFGKLHPALYERLQTVKDDELLPVAIWVAPGQTRTRDQVYEELTAHYPQARQAREQGKAPWDVSDKGLAEEILGAYRKMRLEDTQARIGPLVEALTAERIAVKTFGELPSISALLSKARIVELAKREDVQIIYLIEGEILSEMDTAAKTDRAPGVWQQGISGGNVDIAILEGGNIDTSVTCLSVIATRLTMVAVSGHMTRVASVAACDADPYRGIAYNADLISASSDGTYQDTVDALLWALDAPRNADVVNMSAGAEVNNALNWTDRAIDYWVRERKITFVKSAGNNDSGDHVITSPGKAWNVITVGGIDDHGTSLWQDDEIWNDSSYTNLPGGDREKPEVAAPAVDITTITAGGTPYTASGTSYAAPQVAGLAALLIDRSVALKTRPNAVKAIIMASAVHNVHGPSDIPVPADPNYPDLRDGAGAIDITLADQIADTECLDSGVSRVPCWWHSDEVYIPDNLQWSENRYFYASAGEKIRIALSWYSDSDGGPPAYADVLGMNLNLLVYFQDSLGFYQHIKSSASIDNNYELLEFTAPYSTKYKIWIQRPYGDAGSEIYNSFGVAWTKMATYLPDVRHNDNGWNSTIVVRNDSAEPRDVRITYFNANGDNLGYVNYPGLASGAVWQRTADWSGSAIVNASEDVSVVVHNVNTSSGHTYSYNGIAAADPLNPGWGQVGTDIHLPLLMNANNGWSSSVTIFNTGSEWATISLDYYGQGSGGPYAGPQNVSLGPNASVTYDQSGSACPLVGAGRVRSSNGQPLAVTVRQVHSNGLTMVHNGFSGGATTVALPLVMAGNYGWSTGIAVQNLGMASTNITVQYYPYQSPQTIYNVPPRAAAIFAQSGGPWVGAARITANAGQPVAAVVNETNSSQAMSYNGSLNGSSLIVLPYVRNDGGWTTSAQIQNLDGDAASVVVRVNGSQVWSGTINAYNSVTRYPLPGTGSATVECTNGKRIAAIVNVNVNGSGAGDQAMSYNGVNR